jgi:hypothetical protein
MMRILLLLLVVAIAASLYLRSESTAVASALSSAAPAQGAANTGNRLALGGTARIDRLVIPINDPANLNNLSKAAVLALRTRAVGERPELVNGNYVPSESVFGQIVDGAPWWGIEGQFLNGPGNRSIEGAAEESRFLLNPFLLVAPEFSDWWQQGPPGVPLTCLPLALIWSPREAYGEVSYDAECIRARQRPEFDLIAYNARDLGLGHIYVSYADSKNVTKHLQSSDAYANPQFIHKGGSCGYPGGCNNMSPATPPIDGIQLEGLPATVVVWLWRAPPASIAQAPDMKFAIHFR